MCSVEQHAAPAGSASLTSKINVPARLCHPSSTKPAQNNTAKAPPDIHCMRGIAGRTMIPKERHDGVATSSPSPPFAPHPPSPPPPSEESHEATTATTHFFTTSRSLKKIRPSSSRRSTTSSFHPTRIVSKLQLFLLEPGRGIRPTGSRETGPVFRRVSPGSRSCVKSPPRASRPSSASSYCSRLWLLPSHLRCTCRIIPSPCRTSHGPRGCSSCRSATGSIRPA